MVSAEVGITLLPTLAVKPPVPPSANLQLIPFKAPAPSRRLAMVWRRSSAMHGFLERLAGVVRALPADLLDPSRVGTPPAAGTAAPTPRRGARAARG